MTIPTIVIVPGSSHSSAHFVPLAKALSTAGFTNIHNPTLPSTSTKTAAATSFDPDVEHIRATVMECAERGEDVAIIMHSYGGAPATEAVKGLGREERKKEGQKGGDCLGVSFCKLC
jgi:alpha-beta hydrolase superfamily lysophospholipase